MTITYELRRYVIPQSIRFFSTLTGFSRLQDGDIPALPPIFNRRQAEEWRESLVLPPRKAD